MAKILLSRSAYLCVLTAAALMTAALGCSSSDDDSQTLSPKRTDSSATATVGPPKTEPISVTDLPEPEQPATPPAHEPEESGRRVDEPIVEPVEPAGEPAGGLRLRPNPLRTEDRAADSQPAGGGSPVRSIQSPDNTADTSFDPIKAHGRFFENWSKPRLALVITGRQDGYLEPCGCAGKERMKGGIRRRHSLFKQLRDDWGWPVVALDVGGLVKDFGPQEWMKFETTVDAMKQMGYQAIALGKSDLRLPAGELFSFVANTEALPSPFVSANVALFGFATQMTAKQQIVEKAGIKLGITSVLGKKYLKEIDSAYIEMVDPEAALSALVPAMKQECDLLILLAHATTKETTELAEKFPDFRVVVTAGGPPEPPPRPDKIEETGALLVEVGQKGENAVVLGFYDDLGSEIRYQRVTLDSRYPDSPEMTRLMAAYQDRLRQEGLEGLGIHPTVPHPRREIQGQFVGSKECESCHEESYKIWKNSGHAKAWPTLVNLNPPRNFDPECISCHVVGWHPTHHFPYQGGFLSETETPELVNVGCESCHGPGGAHVKAEMGSDEGLQKKLQEAMVITKEESEERQCMTCHDSDNSPDFDFATYWPLVEHYEDLDDQQEGYEDQRK